MIECNFCGRQFASIEEGDEHLKAVHHEIKEPQIKVKKLHPDAKLPTKVYEGDLGYDLYAYDPKIDSHIVIDKYLQKIPTGIAIELPEGYGAVIKDKSSLAKYGLKILGGVIDNGYKGEIIVFIFNTFHYPYKFNRGDKIAQLILIPLVNFPVVEVSQLTETLRGDKGFGSSGR